MSDTPRLKSGFPATPGTLARRRNAQETPSTIASATSSNGSPTKSPTLPLAPENVRGRRPTSQPVIPLTFLDGPQQRLYAFGFYVLLWGWKLYDWLRVIEDGDSSWWLFLKWIFIDFAFLFGLPELRIPWLELSQFMVTTLFAGHVILNYMLMFNIPLPWQTWLLGFAKVLYDREISISEHNVKLSSILNNHSLIMGKQIINILPEGSAVLNPEQTPYCWDKATKRNVVLPIYFNATVPAEIELVRLDLESDKEETIKIPPREVNKVAKRIRDESADPNARGFRWDYVVKKPGIYRLGKVLDEYKLEVQRTARHTFVVPCPEARIKTTDASHRCIRDLSNLSLEVIGTPPLKIKYSRAINGRNPDTRFQSLQPDGLNSPLVSGANGAASGDEEDYAWVRPARVVVGLNESLTTSGEWEYSINEVHDAFGNVVKYAPSGEEPDPTHPTKGLVQTLAIRERPKISMNGCDLRNPLKVAKGKSATLPISFGPSGGSDQSSHAITWEFSPIDTLTNSGEHGDAVTIGKHTARNHKDMPKISEPGLYTLKSVSSGSCEGEVDEPSTCLLLNPLEPHMSIRSEEIPDKCAGNSIGLRVNLDLVGTPPFIVNYDVITDGRPVPQQTQMNNMRHQLELIPQEAGLHKYVFKSVSDSVYPNVALSGTDKVLEQEVKPAASARFNYGRQWMAACLDSQVEVDVALSGDPPFNLEWETVHEGKRKTERISNIETYLYKIKTPPLTKGGDYIMTLSSVQDKRGCRAFLQDQMKIAVRRQRPRGGFGLLEQKNSIMAVEDTSLQIPLRLQGEGPWTIRYRNMNDSSAIRTEEAKSANHNLVVKSRGVYEILDIRDGECQGTVDTTASSFQVDWFPRPEISVVETDSIKAVKNGFVKQEICEGDIDGFEVKLQGAPPYHVEYEINHKPPHGSRSSRGKELDAALSRAAITMDTLKAGDYTYRFTGLSDNLYNNAGKLQSLEVQQRVNAKPSAVFSKPGQSFRYCVEEQEHEDKIPITLTGVAPFYVEVEIKHLSGSVPETYRIPSINSNSYAMPIPREHLRLGTQQLRIRRVRDAKGCQQKYETGAPSVQIQLFDAPSIYPLESREDFCVGERIAYTLSGTPPFSVTYDFNGRWNAKSETTNFRRVAEKPGDFIISSVSDKASECRAAVNLRKTIHPLPSVQISRGKQSRIDIHEGNEVDILFEFWGSPPFEFTYTRSSNAKKGHRSVVLETRHDVSYDHSKVIKASQEGTYEVVAIKDKFCSFSTQQASDQKDRR